MINITLTDNLTLSRLMELRKTRCFDIVYSKSGITRLPSYVGGRIIDESNFDSSNYEVLFDYYMDNIVDIEDLSISDSDFDIDELSVENASSLIDEDNSIYRKLQKETSIITLTMIDCLNEQKAMKEAQEKEAQELLEVKAEEERIKLELLHKQRQAEEELREKQRKLEEERIEKERILEEERIEREHQEKLKQLEREEQERLEKERLERERLEHEEYLAREEQKRIEQERLERERSEREEKEYQRKLEEERRNAELEIQRKQRELELERIEAEKLRKISEMEYNTQMSISKFNEDIITSDLQMPESFPFIMPIFKHHISQSEKNQTRTLKIGKSKSTSNFISHRVYAIGSAVKESFGTTVAYNFASYMKRVYNQPTLLIDLDMNNSDMSYRFKLKNNIQKAFSLDFEKYLTCFSDNVDNVEFDGVNIDILGCKPFNRMNSIYSEQLTSYDFNNMIYNFGRIYPIIIIDIGNLDDTKEYQNNILYSGVTKNIICYNMTNTSTFKNSLNNTSKIGVNWVTLLCNSKTPINELLVEKKIQRPIAGVIYSSDTVGNPVYTKTINNHVASNWSKIVNKIGR
jgi:Mrp family chromosome partitioning ATPase